jgi:hypothetical protein
MDTIDLPPWECIDPALTADRLAAIAAMVREETDAKIDARDERDWNWNIGCDCHAWVLNRMHLAGTGEYADWLFVESRVGDLDLEFRIGGKNGVAAKLYRPDAPGQPARTLKTANEEMRVIQRALGEALAPEPDPVVRLAYAKNDEGRITAVRLVQLSVEGALWYTWTIWSADMAVIGIDEAPKPEGIELNEPRATLPEDEAQADEKGRADKREGA